MPKYKYAHQCPANIIEAEPEVTKYDTLVDDSNCGLCLKTGAEAVVSHIQSASLSTSDVIQLVTSIAHMIEKKHGRHFRRAAFDLRERLSCRVARET
jgi:hypothetical protein